MIQPGNQVEHEDFGIGKVVDVLGDTAVVEFFGERIDVDVSEITLRGGDDAPVVAPTAARKIDHDFRKSFEAVNLGVVPTNPDQLIKLTIGGESISEEIQGVLANAEKGGAHRIFMGYYGSGKSHHLSVVKAIALQKGWVTASIELDPKAADPAKPSTVYRSFTTNLEFPERSDGSKSMDFCDLVKEMRDHWTNIRSLPYFSRCPWYRSGVEALLYLPHRRDDEEYMSAVNWLAGQVKLIGAIRKATWREGYKGKIPPMPQTKDTGLIYAYLLVVLHEVLKELGYRGLALIIDEAEHVRTYSANRYLRANNFLDILARCAHAPRGGDDPASDFDWEGRPGYWKEGPHFALFVGLTEGEDMQDLRRRREEMGVLIHSRGDLTELSPPAPDDYERWVAQFLTETSQCLGPDVATLDDPELRSGIARLLRDRFEAASRAETTLRNWTKLAGLPAAVLLSRTDKVGGNDLMSIMESAALEVSGDVLPWDD